jgi:hypothetical protein
VAHKAQTWEKGSARRRSCSKRTPDQKRSCRDAGQSSRRPSSRQAFAFGSKTMGRRRFRPTPESGSRRGTRIVSTLQSCPRNQHCPGPASSSLAGPVRFSGLGNDPKGAGPNQDVDGLAHLPPLHGFFCGVSPSASASISIHTSGASTPCRSRRAARVSFRSCALHGGRGEEQARAAAPISSPRRSSS